MLNEYYNTRIIIGISNLIRRIKWARAHISMTLPKAIGDELASLVLKPNSN